MNSKDYIDLAETSLMHTYNRYPIVWDHGEGVYLYDLEGRRYLDFAAGIGFDVLHLEYSPIKGPEGNIEYLLHLRKNETKAMRFGIHTEEEAEANLQKLTAEAAGESQKPEWKALIMATVQNAHKSLGKKGPGT